MECLQTDNASGHGKRQADERRVRRRESRNKSQLFMCRQPRRTSDDDDCSSCSSTESFSSLPLSPPLQKKLGVDRSFSPTSVAEYATSTAEAKFDSPRGGRSNALKPVRRGSFGKCQPMRVSGALQAKVADSRRLEHRPATAPAMLVDILSTLEL